MKGKDTRGQPTINTSLLDSSKAVSISEEPNNSNFNGSGRNSFMPRQKDDDRKMILIYLGNYMSNLGIVDKMNRSMDKIKKPIEFSSK